MSYKLILLRHGESIWNAKNLFTGWVDVELSEKGLQEAARGGQLLKEANLLPDVLHTSLLKRAIDTADIALKNCGRTGIATKRSWRLNERHYGALQGKDKAATLKEYGEGQFQLWRRSFDVPPPAIADDDQYSQKNEPKYADLGELLPKTECLKDVVARVVPYLTGEITQDLKSNKTVLIGRLNAGSYINSAPEAATGGESEDGQDVGDAPAGGPGGRRRRRRPRGAAEAAAAAAGGGGEAEAGC